MSKNQEMDYEIKDLDLINKESKYHSSCYKESVHGYSNSAKLTYEDTTSSKRTFNIKVIEEFTEIHVIRDHEIVSMSQLQDIYGDKTRKDIHGRRNKKRN